MKLENFKIKDCREPNKVYIISAITTILHHKHWVYHLQREQTFNFNNNENSQNSHSGISGGEVSLLNVKSQFSCHVIVFIIPLTVVLLRALQNCHTFH